MDIRIVPALLAVAALAGCTADPSETQQDLEHTYGLQGVVVDSTITPVADVIVTLAGGNATSTDANGAFGFLGLEQPTQQLTFEKPGFIAQQIGPIDLERTDEPLKVTLERVPTDVPYVVPMEWTGFMSCSFYVANFFGTGCLVQDHLDDGSRTFDTLDAVPEFMQSEMLWTHSQPAGTNLCLRHYASSGIGGDILADDACGPSPLTVPIGREALQNNGVGNTRGMERVTWVDHWLADGTAGFAIDQRFTVFTHQFHNFAPADGWTFLQDGAPSLP